MKKLLRKLRGGRGTALEGDAAAAMRRARREGREGGARGRGRSGGTSGLYDAQAANFKRYTRKLPQGAQNITVRDLPDGGKVFSADVPGRVPGSKAVYEKYVDSAGKTVRYTKTTYDPQRRVVHVKEK